MATIGPHFPEELQAAGLLGLPFSWDANGNMSGVEALTSPQQIALAAVIAAHDPNISSSQGSRYAAFKADVNYQALLAQLKAATPAQVQSYITTNVTDLPSARAMLIKIALVLALVANGS